jgi:hypothetical protein
MTFDGPLPLPGGLRLWACLKGGYTWTIIYEPGEPDWSDEERARWVGYTAVYRQSHIIRLPRLDGTLGEDMTKVGGGRVFSSLAACEAACRRTFKSILAAH